MKKLVRSLVVTFIGVLMVLFCFTSNSDDEKFYKDAKQTNATIDKITKEEKTVYRRRRKVHRTSKVIKYHAHISFEVENNGEIITQKAVLKDVSSNLKEGDTVSVFYKGTDVRMRTQEQSKQGNTLLGFVGVLMLLVGVISFKSSKSSSEYDELSGEENIYSNSNHS